MMEKEVRIIPNEASEVRAIGGRKVEGYGIVFNSESRDLGGFREIILPEAMDGVIERSDILALLNHDQGRGLLARSTKGKGSLTLENTKKGVKYSFTAPKTNLGEEVIEGIQRGDIRTSSFAFSIAKDEDAPFEKQPDGTWLRTVKRFDQIFDVSPVYREAYEDTSVALRSLDAIKSTDISGEVTFDEKSVTVTVTEEAKEEEIKEERTEDPPEEIRTEPEAEEPAIEPAVKEEPKEEKQPIRVNNLKNEKMTLTELRDLRAKALEENEAIYELKKVENRIMTEKEEAIVSENNQRIKEYDLEIETETRKQGNGRVISAPYILRQKDEKFSLMKAILAKAEMREMPGVARDVFIHGKEDMRRSGVGYSGDIVIPSYLPKEFRADILAGTATQGQEIVAEDKKTILPPLVNKLVFRQAGCTWMEGLSGNVSIPTYAGTSVAWKAEVTTATDGGGAFSEVEFSPKKITGFINVSKQFLLQDSVGAEQLLLDNISNAVARHLEATILGVAAGSSTQPQGMGYKVTTGTDTQLASVVPTQAYMVAMETEIDSSNALQENLAYITNAAARGILKSKTKNATYGEIYLCEDNMVNGYPLLVTNSASTAAGTDAGELIVFGNWKDLGIAQWGGYDITVDPYTAAKTGQVVITINAFFDAKGLRGAASTDVHADGTQDDYYAVSFSSLPLKAS